MPFSPSPPSSSPSSTAAQFFTLPFRRRKQRYTLNPPDDAYNVIYLGNVLTMIAKGDGCVEKPLSLIWKTYCSRARPDLHMKLAVTRQGLKAETRQQGLTEYWAHRITFCFAPPQYPRLFCWVYKHEGKRMKPELRCHAVLCRKPSEPSQIAQRLMEFLAAALAEYKREKLCMQNSRLASLATGGTCPRRKLLLQTGTLNFRPPVSRTKSAPRLGSIDEEDEAVVEEHEDDEEQEDDFSDFDSLCYRENPSADDECAASSSSSGGSSLGSTASSPFLNQGSNSPNETVVPPPEEQFQFPPSRSNVRHRSASSVELPSSLSMQPPTAALAAIALSVSTKSRRAPAEPDSVSDESGYHEEERKQLILDGEEYDEFYSDRELNDDDDEQVTAL